MVNPDIKKCLYIVLVVLSVAWASCAPAANTPAGRDGTIIVAASDASAQSKAQADIVCDGTGDESDINAALSSLTSGGTVVLTEGTFIGARNSPVIMPANTWLKGQGKATILATLTGGDQDSSVILASNVAGIMISALFIDCGYVGGPTSSAIKFTNVDNSRIENIWIDGRLTTNALIRLDSDSDGNTIKDCNLWDSALMHIVVHGKRNVIQSNIISCSYAGGEGISLYHGAAYNTVQGNTLKHIGDGLICGFNSTYNSFMGNILYDSLVNPICLYDDSHYCSVTGNIAYSWGDSNTGQNGIYVNENSTNHKIIGNTLIQTPGYGAPGDSYGIFLRQSTDGAYRTAHDNIIIGNEIRNTKVYGICLQGSLAVRLQRVVCERNIIVSCNGTGIATEGVHNSTIRGNIIEGCRGDSIYTYAANDVIIEGNRCNGNTGYGIHIAGYKPWSDALYWAPLVRNNILNANTLGPLNVSVQAGDSRDIAWLTDAIKAFEYRHDYYRVLEQRFLMP